MQYWHNQETAIWG